MQSGERKARSEKARENKVCYYLCVVSQNFVRFMLLGMTTYVRGVEVINESDAFSNIRSYFFTFIRYS